MDGLRDDQNKSDKERQLSYDTTYMGNLKYDTNELIYKTEIDSQVYRTNLWLPKGKVGWEGINYKFGLRCTHYYT